MTTGATKYLGARVPRKEDPRLLTGRGRYVADLKLPGMLHVAFVRSEHAHARIAGIEPAAALALPGVVAVVTAADIAGQIRPIQGEARYEGFRSPDWPILAGDVVRYQGEPLAAVVAASRYLAEDAAEAVAVDYAPLPAVTDALAA
ncbi:MAG TPA: xanthine dehydrogenase family protein molybdopterin-binding subunit, partial [Dehalococcoidia bacterium]|nr:xanthine dehydrogenase family protein molybdopterin-binding subunit [Dehalococcoidia bacterium]